MEQSERVGRRRRAVHARRPRADGQRVAAAVADPARPEQLAHVLPRVRYPTAGLLQQPALQLVDHGRVQAPLRAAVVAVREPRRTTHSRPRVDF